MNYQSLLRKAEGMGSAKSGSHHWIMQRITAVALMLLGIWFMAAFIIYFTAPYDMVQGWLKSTWNASFAILFITISFYHGYLGLQVIWEDYIPNQTIRWGVILATKFVSALLALVSVIAILKVYLG